MKTTKPKLIIFASGSATGGGSGFEKLVEAQKANVLEADIVAVVSNHKNGGVAQRAKRLGVSFIYFKGPYTDTAYQRIIKDTGAEWTALSGWLKLVKGLNPKKTFNIHPALLSYKNGVFGGRGMWGHHVHEAVKKELDKKELSQSGFTMHFVNSEYDKGQIIFEKTVPLTVDMSAEEIGKAVNALEHKWQAILTNKIIHNKIETDRCSR